MKNTTTILLGTMAIMLIGVGCSKKTHAYDVNEVGDAIAEVRESTALSVNPGNLNNPLDSVGEIHNLILDAIAFHPGFDTLNLIPFSYQYVNSSLGWDALSEYLPLNTTNSVISNIWGNGDNADIESIIEYLEGVGGFSQEIVDELHILFSVLNLEREFYPIGELIDSIKVKESNFMSSTTTFTESEYFMYLGTASVLRFSAAYWDAVI